MLMGVTSLELGVLRVPLIMVPDTTDNKSMNNVYLNAPNPHIALASTTQKVQW
jgi:hypothetical protein